MYVCIYACIKPRSRLGTGNINQESLIVAEMGP